MHLETVLEDTRTVISFDGSDHEIEKGEPIELAEGAHTMTLHNAIRTELTNLGSGGPRIGGRRRCDRADSRATSSSGIRWPCRSISCACRRPSWPSADPRDLERIGKSLSERLTYLMEPISPIEIDADACVVQLRSNPPQRDDDGRSYYELIVRRGGEIALSATAKKMATPASRSRPM